MTDAISGTVTPPVFSGTGEIAAKPRTVAEAAKQFEALLLNEMLKMARGDGEGWMGSGDDASASTANGLAEQYLAQAMAAQGGLGLAKAIEKGLQK